MNQVEQVNQERVWERGWDGHERAQLGRWALIPFAQKLQWLEEAHHLALHFQSNRAKQNHESKANEEAASST